MLYSETFLSAQGEGTYIGCPSVWIRFFMCNLQCDGFGQDDPTDPSTYDLPYTKIDISDITQVEDLPVFDKGCDSSYTWSKKYKHLMRDKTAEEIVDIFEGYLPDGKWIHPFTKTPYHLALTGGEPFTPNNQRNIIELWREMLDRGNYPRYVTVETNGTKALLPEMRDLIEEVQWEHDVEWFMSVSPKLWNTAGEKPEKAIKPDVVRDYACFAKKGQLKFVVNGTEQSWQEMEDVISRFRQAGCDFPVWVMGIGGTYEGLVKTEADIADECLVRGYNYTSRVHVHIYGNAIGK